jgi:hypothetical protein
MKAARRTFFVVTATAALALIGYFAYVRSAENRSAGGVQVHRGPGPADYAWRLPANSRTGRVLELGIMDQDGAWLATLTEPVAIEAGSKTVIVLVSGNPNVPLTSNESLSISLSIVILDDRHLIKHASTTAVDNFVRPAWYLGIVDDKTSSDDVELLGWKREFPGQRPLLLSLVARFRDAA